MAFPVRSLRPAGPPGSRSGARADDRSDDRPELKVVPARRRVAWVAMLLMSVVAGLMLGAAYLHSRISERQLEIDRLDEAFRTAQADFDVLRAERSVLRSPTRLADEAGALGMVPGRESEFVPVDPMVLAVVIAQTGELPYGDELVTGSFSHLEPLDQYRLAKSAAEETP